MTIINSGWDPIVRAYVEPLLPATDRYAYFHQNIEAIAANTGFGADFTQLEEALRAEYGDSGTPGIMAGQNIAPTQAIPGLYAVDPLAEQNPIIYTSFSPELAAEQAEVQAFENIVADNIVYEPPAPQPQGSDSISGFFEGLGSKGLIVIGIVALLLFSRR